MDNGKRKCKIITIEQKSAMLRAVESGVKKKKVAEDFGVSLSTLSTILSKREAIADAVARGVKGDRMKLRAPAFEAVEKAVFNWFLEIRASGTPVSGALLQQKARNFACIMGHDDFVASNGWLQRFKERHDIVGRAVSGESLSVDREAAVAWIKKNIGQLLEKYSPRDLFNADETALFYQMLPQKTLALKGDRCQGGKQSKVRVTVLLCANMDGSEKVPALVIGKSASPRCFKGKRKLQVSYVANHKAWMTREIFAQWLREWDERLGKQNRKICLVLDNCAAHHTTVVLKNIELCFLPANTTAVVQPLDQGVIMNFKSGYRKRVIDRILLNMSMKRETTIDLYMAIEMLQAAWIAVTASTIANCFRHASFGVSSGEPSEDLGDVASEGAAGDQAQTSWDALLDANVVPDCDTFCTYVGADADAVTTEELSDAEIVRAVTGVHNDDSDECVDTPEPNEPDVPTPAHALDATDLLRRFFGAHDDGEDGLEIAAAAERAVIRLKKSRQKSIKDYFSSK
nr:tigger transposable element-derived protein 6-like [Rhipicephalus microplus]